MMLETKRQKPPKWEYTAVGVDPGDGFDVGGGVGKGKNGTPLATFEIRFSRSVPASSLAQATE